MYGSTESNMNLPHGQSFEANFTAEENDFILKDDKKRSYVSIYVSMISFGLLVLAFMAFITTQNSIGNGSSQVLSSASIKKSVTWPEKGMVLSSNDVFTDQYMGGNYTCEVWGYVSGVGNNPGFYWSNYPKKTKSFVLIMGKALTAYGTDGYKANWVLYNIPASTPNVTTWCDIDGTCPGDTGSDYPSDLARYNAPCSRSKSVCSPHMQMYTLYFQLMLVFLFPAQITRTPTTYSMCSQCQNSLTVTSATALLKTSSA